MSESFNPVEALDSIKDSYRNYVSSFQKFKNPTIKDWVNDRIKEGNLLYKGPYIQLGKRFEKGDSFDQLVKENILHPTTPSCFTMLAGDTSQPPVSLYKHQSDAIRSILSDKNTIISTGTGSGKSFCFGIPVVHTCLQMQDNNINGIKAIFVYPMNALANSQYDDFAQRLEGSGLKIALYTGDTPWTREEALDNFRSRMEREPLDSELISREEIQNDPPDILLTNYVMLEYILTRFEDRKLFPEMHRGVLKYLVLDEIHTYTGRKGADVAYLIRRLKQSTNTQGKLRCIGTSATVQKEEGANSDVAITEFASNLFGEQFSPDAVIHEQYVKPSHFEDTVLAKNILVTKQMLDEFENTDSRVRELTGALLDEDIPADATRSYMGQLLNKQATIKFIENELAEDILDFETLTDNYHRKIRPLFTKEECSTEILGAFLAGMHTRIEVYDKLVNRLIPKVHTFFSQGRQIKSCITLDSVKTPHLNDAGEVICPICASRSNKENNTFPLVFCRSCGQEYYCVEVLDDGTLTPHELGESAESGKVVYLYPGKLTVDKESIPEKWLTDKKQDISAKYRKYVELPTVIYCPTCNKLYSEDETNTCICSEKVEMTMVPAPFTFCPSEDCGVYYDRRTRKEFNKLFSFGTVGRSTATDVLVSNTLNNLPETQQKIIAFSDNRQDTALQAAHMNNIQKRIDFRRGIYLALKNNDGELKIENIGEEVFRIFKQNNVYQNYSKTPDTAIMARSGNEKNIYQNYLKFNAILELGSPRQKNQPNLEDVGLLKIDYTGLDQIASDTDYWKDVSELMALDNKTREDYLKGFLDIMRYNTAIAHEYLTRPEDFKEKIISKLNEDVLFHNELATNQPTGYLQEGKSKRKGLNILKLVSHNGNLVKWTKKVFGISDYETLEKIVLHVTSTFEELKGIIREHVNNVPLLMVNPLAINFVLPETDTCKVCKKCGKVHHFNQLNYCTGTNCIDLFETTLEDNYFRKEYTRGFNEVTPLHSEEHSGQIDGDTRKSLEVRFRNDSDDLNVIVCTPTMELGIDIGNLSAVYMRNVPPSPSNYAQRAGRAGRSSQASMISTFCGVGMKRGPHDQYFYRFPQKIISGEISVPRFLLDNKTLAKAHLHSLIIQSLDIKFPPKINQILDMDQFETMPMFSDIEAELKEETLDKKDIEDSISEKFVEIKDSIKLTFHNEMEEFDWFNDDFIDNTINSFVNELDSTFNSFREEYRQLDKELNNINTNLRSSNLEQKKRKTYHIRREAIENKLGSMREGIDEYSTYRFLSGHGFVPNYGFPTKVTNLSIDYRTSDGNKEITLSRDRTKAIREYAPGNTVYYRGGRYTIRSAHIKTENNKPIKDKILICPTCNIAYLNDDAVFSGGVCSNCGEDLTDVPIYENAIQMPDQQAKSRRGITSDEEERQRKGYDIRPYYIMSKGIKQYQVGLDDDILMKMRYDHTGQILNINYGPLDDNDEEDIPGFTFCSACSRWLLSQNAVKEHLEEKGPRQCWRGATKDDIIDNILLYTDSVHDVLTIECEPPEHLESEDYDAFYTTLATAFMEGLQICMNMDEDELNAFLKPNPENTDKSIIVIFEVDEGGAGALKSMKQTSTFHEVVRRTREILHEFDTNGCEKACYDCLCTYYNQRVQHLLDRKLVLPFLSKLSKATVTTDYVDTSAANLNFEDLLENCDSEFEKDILHKIREYGLPLPTNSQKQITDESGSPVAKPDFIYDGDGMSLLIFVDGPDHDKDSIKADDEKKRQYLDLIGYSYYVIRYDVDLGEQVKNLHKIITN